MPRLSIFLGLVACLWMGAGCDRESASDAGRRSGQEKRLKLAVIPKGTTHIFWRTVEAGAQRAADELNVEVHWKGPLREDDRGQQIAIVEQFVSDRVDGIALAPLDEVALVRPVEAAAAAGIPVVIFDSALRNHSTRTFVSFVATNNRLGGQLAGEEMARLLNGKGNIVLLRYKEGSASTTEREAGFLEVIAQHPQMKILVENRYAGATVAEAQTSALNLLDQIRQADGIFCPNESSATGMLLALRQNGLAGKVKYIGFDASPPLIAGLKAGEIDALVSQNPERMGYEAVKSLVDHLRGKTVPPVVDTGCALITRENLDSPDVKKLLP